MAWLLLAFIPSSLMLGVTTYITTDLASVPLLWIIPLALYLGTFIIAFAKKPLIRLESLFLWQGIALIALILLQISGAIVHPFIIIGIHLGLFFITALMCHMQLAVLRPPPSHLTKFYLIMSTGGVLGGIFNALIAPWLFLIPLEYVLVLALSVFVRYFGDSSQPLKAIRSAFRSRDIMMIAAAVLAALALIGVRMLQETGPIDLANIIIPIGSFVILLTLVMNINRRWVFAAMAGEGGACAE